MADPTYKDAIVFFFNDIKRMAAQLDAETMPTFWTEIHDAHQAMMVLLQRNTPPWIPQKA